MHRAAPGDATGALQSPQTGQQELSPREKGLLRSQSQLHSGAAQFTPPGTSKEAGRVADTRYVFATPQSEQGKQHDRFSSFKETQCSSGARPAPSGRAGRDGLSVDGNFAAK